MFIYFLQRLSWLHTLSIWVFIASAIGLFVTIFAQATLNPEESNFEWANNYIKKAFKILIIALILSVSALTILPSKDEIMEIQSNHLSR